MARYDDGGIEFAEQQFAAARKYKAEQAKKTETFAKRMLAVQGIAKMGNAIMNAKAEELEKKQVPQRAAYDAWNTKAEKLKAVELTRQSENKSVHDHLASLYSTQLIEQLTAEYPTRNINLLKPYAIREGKRLAKENQSEYEEMISSANAIPTFENFPEYYESANVAPRSIGDWISKGVRRGLRRNNQDTIEYDNQQADPLYGTGLWKKYGEFADSLEQYDLVTGKGYELTQIIEQAKKEIISIREEQRKFLRAYKINIKKTAESICPLKTKLSDRPTIKLANQQQEDEIKSIIQIIINITTGEGDNEKTIRRTLLGLDEFLPPYPHDDGSGRKTASPEPGIMLAGGKRRKRRKKSRRKRKYRKRRKTRRHKKRRKK